MGMFDDITVKYPLPDTEAQGLSFQTRSLDNLMDHYIITEDGRLIKEHWDYENTPEEEKPFPNDANPLKALFGSMRRVEGSYRRIDMEYHGDVIFYGDEYHEDPPVLNPIPGEEGGHRGPSGEWYEYRARFSDGKLSWIRRIPNVEIGK